VDELLVDAERTAKVVVARRLVSAEAAQGYLEHYRIYRTHGGDRRFVELLATRRAISPEVAAEFSTDAAGTIPMDVQSGSASNTGASPPSSGAGYPPLGLPGGPMGTPPSSAYGAAPSSGYGAAPSSAYGAAPSSGYGAAPSSAYGAAPSSGYGAAPSSGYGAAPSSAYGAAAGATPQTPAWNAGSADGPPVFIQPAKPSAQATRTDGAKTIGPYTIVKELGRGGQGVVYHARSETWEEVALKVMLSGGLSKHARERFKREKDILDQLDHPGIVRLLGSGTTPQGDWIAMDFVDGQDLTKLIRSGGLSMTRRLGLLCQVARAVHSAHEHGIVHRDLKPANILVASGDQVKVMDFGLAKDLDRMTLLTDSGAIVGTPHYMAPEQVDREMAEIGPLSDVFALGVVLYELITGQRPFQAPTGAGLYRQIVEVEPEAPIRVDSSLPQVLSDICLKALQKRPEDRYPSAKALADDLDRLKRGEEVKVRLKPKLFRLDRRQQLGIAAIAFTVLFVLGALLWVFVTRRSIDSKQVKIAAELRTRLLDGASRMRKNNARDASLADAAIDELIAVVKEAESFGGYGLSGEAGMELKKLVSSERLKRSIGASLIGRARRAEAERAFSKAVADLDSAARWLPESDPLRVEIRLVEARARFAAGDLKRAHALIDAQLADKPGELASLQIEAKILEEEGSIKAALKSLTLAAKGFEGQAKAEVEAERARLMSIAGEPKEAKKLFAALRKAYPRSVAILVSEARALRARDQVDKASNTLALAARLAPKDKRIRRERLALLIAQERFAAAQSELDAWLQANPQAYHLLVDRAEIQLILGRVDEARADAEAAIARVRDDADRARAGLVLVRLSLIDQDPDAARRKLKTVLARTPRMIAAQHLACALARGSDKEQKVLDAAQAILPRDSWVMARRGFLLLRSGKPKQARRLAQEIRKQAPKNLDAGLILAACNARLAEADLAHKSLGQYRTLRHESVRSGRGAVGRAFRLSQLPSRILQRRARDLMRLQVWLAPEDCEAIALLAKLEQGARPRILLARIEEVWSINRACGRLAFQRAILLRILGRKPGEVAQSLEVAIKTALNPREQADALAAKALAFGRQGQQPSAMKTLAQAEKLLGQKDHATRVGIAKALGVETLIRRAEKAEKDERSTIRSLINKCRRTMPPRGGLMNSPAVDAKLRVVRGLLDQLRAIAPRDPDRYNAEANYWFTGLDGHFGIFQRAQRSLTDPSHLQRIYRLSALLAPLVEFRGQAIIEDAVSRKILHQDLVPYVEAILAVYQAAKTDDPGPGLELALKKIELQLQTRADSVTFYLLRGMVLYGLGRDAEAKADLDLVSALGQVQETILAKVVGYALRGRTDEAASLLEKLLSQGMNETTIRGHSLLQKVFLKKGLQRFKRR